MTDGISIFVRFIVIFILFFVVYMIAFYRQSLIRKRDSRQMPSKEEKEEWLNKISELKKEGASYQDCIKNLTNRGLRKGVARELLIEYEKTLSIK
jgi:flagellar biosynthesis/type III secretory pathway M-ring protein FliF/YscJ